MNNECKIAFFCKHSEESPCAFHSKEKVCKYAKQYKDIVACISKRAKIHAMEMKLRRMEVKK